MATIADLVIRLSANTTPAEKDIKSFGGKVQKGFGKALLPAVGILGGLVVAGKKAADSASDLGESQNAVNVVFGKGAKTIHDFSRVADKEAGLSMRQLNELVTPLGAAFTNMGDSQQVAADKSVTLAKRAADMASVFNVDVSEALGAIQAGLRGEADPLERFGVGLSDAAVSGHALTMGLAKTTAELTAGDKAQARYALLLEQTDKLQGDFKNTSEGAANAARINAAAQENLTAKMGNGLLPVVESAQKLIGKLTGVMAKNEGPTKVAAAAIAILAVSVIATNTAMALAPAAALLARLAFMGLAASATTADKIMRLTLIGAIASLALGIVIAYQKSEKFREVVHAVFDAVKTVVLTAVSFILSAIDKYLGAIEMVLRAASKLPIVGDKFKGLADAVGGARDKVQGLQSSINGLRSKTVTITTVHASIYTREERLPGNVIGARAFGGSVMGRMPYLVGERGPEVFVPNVSGSIVPNDELGGGNARPGSPALHIENLTVNDPVDVDLLASRVAARLARR